MAAHDLVGTWGLDSQDQYGSWLQVTKNDNGELEASLLWRVGSARKPQKLEVHDDHLVLHFKRNRPINGKRMLVHVRYDVRKQPAQSAQIQVTETKFSPDGQQLKSQPRSAVATGRRMPDLPPRPDLKQIKWGPERDLFNGKDLTGWSLKPATAKNGWRAANGELVNETPKTDFSAYGEFGNLRTHETFADHQLHIEFNVDKGCNSGVYVRGMYEAQVVDRDSRMQGIQGVGAIFGRIAPSKQAGKPGGQWQTYDLTLVDRHITVVLNGERVINNQPIIGCTGGAMLGDVTRPGPLFLQGDHTSVRYRNIRIRRRIPSPEE